MRIFIKGGVWKNTEDEILKAAVMKYGKNQWNRVASLLTRKNGAQCKARWYEWLDPSIKKTDWSREEDEKLLHMAKIMPTQWRTIAPSVGRTAGQCLERYEFLLDAAQRKDGEMEKDEDAIDPRRLRAGEVDPTPEARPARPDPIDMDDDEKEMLSEARARLANTRGKKAKRKAREKQLMEAKRLASLQKKRELKAAGIFSGPPRKKQKGIDYNAEIPFEKDVPLGFHDVSAEHERERSVTGDKEFRMVQVNKLEEIRRDQEEQRAALKDKQKFQKLEKMNVALAVNMISEENDPMNVRKRSKLTLPAPTISDSELHEIVKAGASSSQLILSDGSAATSALVGSYSATPLSSGPMRTPAPQNLIETEARNHFALFRTQTPLLGGQNIELQGEGTGFGGVKPNMLKHATPNVLGDLSSGMTPAPGGRGGYTGGRSSVAATPLRDEFGLNRGDSSALVIADPRGDKVRQQQAAFAVRKGFMSLPAPEDKYDIVVPDVIPEDTSLGMDIEEDASDRAERLARAEREVLELELKRRSQVVKRALPRPSVISGSPHCKDSLNPAELIAAELYCLMQHDATKFPLGDGRKVKNVFVLPNDLSDDSLSAARALLDTEIQIIRRESEIKGESDDTDKWWKVWTAAYNDSIIYKDACVLASSLSTSEYVQYCKKEFEALKDSIGKESSAASKLQKKTEIKTAGYVKKSVELDEKMMTANALNADLEIELSCYRMLSKMEKEAIPSRMFKISEEVEGQELREKALQKRYELLLKQRRHLQSIIEQQ